MIYRYAHPEDFKDWEKPDIENIKKPLILWGAGKIGGVAAHCLKKRGVHYEAFCDIARDKQGTRFCGHEVISPEELKSRYPDAVVIITSVFYTDTMKMLRALGYQEAYDCSSLFMEIDFSDYDFWTSREYAIRNVEQCLAGTLEQRTSNGVIDQIYLNITTKCSLRCRECCAFIPYVSNPCHYPAEDIMADFNKVLDGLHHVRVVNFYGGEPLLHPELAGMIRSLKQEKRIDRISIISNGTILPDENVLRAMEEENRFLVRLSNYGSLSHKLPKITEVLDRRRIRYEITNYSYWDRQSVINATGETEEELVAKFRLCTSCNELMLLNRKGYLCITSSAGCNTKGFPPSSNNYIDLLDDDHFQEKLKHFVTRPGRGEYLDACKYCSGMHCVQFEQKVPVAEQTKELLTFPKLY